MKQMEMRAISALVLGSLAVVAVVMMTSTMEQDEVLARESVFASNGMGSDLAGLADPQEPATEGADAAATEDAADAAATEDAPAEDAPADPEPEPAAPSGGAGAGYLHPDDLYKPDLGKPVWEGMGKAKGEQPVDYSNKPKGSELQGWDEEWNKSVNEPLSMSFPAPKTRTKLRRDVQTVYRDWSRRVWRRKAAYEQSVDDQRALGRLHVAAAVARSRMVGAKVHEVNKKYALDHQSRQAKRRMERDQMEKKVQQETAKANAAAISKQVVPPQRAVHESMRDGQEKEELRAQISALAAKVSALEAKQAATPTPVASVVATPAPTRAPTAAPTAAPTPAETEAKTTVAATPAANATIPTVAEAAPANVTAASATNSTLATANMKYVQSSTISLV